MAIETISRSDQDIQSAVLDELAWEPRVRPHEIGVTVVEGVVTLTGRVDSYAKKWAAERAAHRVTRVRAVANDLAVRLATGAERADLAAVAAASDSARNANAALHAQVRDAWLNVYSTFTPEQKGVVKDALSQRMAKMQQWREKMQQRHSSGG